MLTVAAQRSDAFSDAHAGQLQQFAELLELAVTRIEDTQRLAAQAFSDPLTGLPNHRAFHERLSEEVQRAYRHQRPLAIALLDVDHFKTVNDSFGHQHVDRLLATVAKIFAGEARTEDVVARIGGDEFTLLLPDTTKEQAAVICERLRRALAASSFPPAEKVTLSIGITDLSDALTAESLIALADGALYWSKGNGRDRVCIYDPDLVGDFSATDRAEQLERSQRLLGLRALARAIDAKHPSTHLHSDGVARVAAALAEQLDWHAPDVALLQEAALLHDTGKLALRESILLKPDRLTQDEYDDIQRHPLLGAEIVEGVLTDQQVAWIRCHHERPDGNGYPYQLDECDIPQGAALLAIAEAWDTMTAAHPYRRAKNAATALQECRDLAGCQFSTEAVHALEAIIASGIADDRESFSTEAA